MADGQIYIDPMYGIDGGVQFGDDDAAATGKLKAKQRAGKED